MLIVILIVCVMLILGGAKYSKSIKNDSSADGWEVFAFIGLIGVVIDFVMLIILSACLSSEMTIGQKIKMFTEENIKIENDISLIVENYMKWESDTYVEFKTEDSIVLVNLYPELKSNELVTQQIKVHLENHNKIKSLKLEKINNKLIKWWIYFDI